MTRRDSRYARIARRFACQARHLTDVCGGAIRPFRYCGTVGATAGLYNVVRAGLNLFELTDFILGWTTFDLLNDDEINVQHLTPQTSSQIK